MAAKSVRAETGAEASGFRRLWRVARQLFHEMVGATFAVLALAWANAAFRASRLDVAYWLISTAALVALIMAAFAWTSFRSARRVR
jgi:hypothetical protein